MVDVFKNMIHEENTGGFFMSINDPILISETKSPKTIPNPDGLGFGEVFSDHMLIMDFDKGSWQRPRIQEYAPIMLHPSSMVLHYGQSVFEGMKAYKRDGKVFLFRPEKNFERMNQSNIRMCIPQIHVPLAMEALKTLLLLDQRWIPEHEGTSLYIRPFVFATDPFLGVRPSETYQFIVITSPVGSYYPEGINPVKIFVEEKYVRSVRGGVGFAKTVGNYAASLKAQMESKEKGFSQVLWLDAIERKYVEEVGTMNVFFVIDGQILTPSLADGSILPGITRDSCIELLKHWGYRVTERKISMDEILTAHANGKLDEVFGTGTAAVISPIGELYYQDKAYPIHDNQMGTLAKKLYQTITSIQYGQEEDVFGWVKEIR
jgi:branched-chain amino acid aminotransferase